MKRLFKRIVTFLRVLTVLIVVGVIGVMIFADRTVRSAVESAGAKTLNVPVLVGDADVSFLGGTLGLRNLTVKNPQGYEGPALLTLQAVNVKADTGSLFGDEIVIKDMTLSGMEVFVEQKGLQNNLYEVIQPLREPREPTGKRLIIDKLTISPDIVVHISLPTLPGQQAQAVSLKVAPITMTDLGRDERMDTAVLISKVFLAVARSIAEESSGVLPKETVGEITNVLDKAIDLGRTIFGGKKKE
ncbi:MAG TPA: hypothetical protein VLI39_03830 [Sedimentisphaerales bacterium]|nr:hypothetical protein [Sedimentisphaerales bacterium]